MRRLFYLVFWAIGLFILESFIKYYLILNKIPKAGFYFFNHFLQIGFYQNANLAFGVPLPPALIIALIVFALLALCYFWWLSLLNFNRAQVFAFSLIILGATSNLLDRLFFGFVIDYINVFVWPVFNLADAMIVAGVLIIFISLIKNQKNII